MKPNRSRAGWTLVEFLLAAGLTGLVMTKASLVLREAFGAAGRSTAMMHTEDQARAVMERISLAVMGSDRESLFPGVESVHSSAIRYSMSLGIEDGELVWSAPEEIRLDGTSVEWRENPGAVEEQRVTWSSLVSPLLAGETVNGVDDNENGLVDEDGLSFVLEGESVRIRLTIQRPELDGRTVPQTVESVVYIRN
ncbi:MAG: hypothetical protein ABL998_12825 [Planctomycetota bacterium]